MVIVMHSHLMQLCFSCCSLLALDLEVLQCGEKEWKQGQEEQDWHSDVQPQGFSRGRFCLLTLHYTERLQHLKTWQLYIACKYDQQTTQGGVDDAHCQQGTSNISVGLLIQRGSFCFWAFWAMVPLSTDCYLLILWFFSHVCCVFAHFLWYFSFWIPDLLAITAITISLLRTYLISHLHSFL